MSDFERILSKFRAQGKPMGEGVFRWDFERATELLPDYQSLSETEYLIRLVSSAVASGATQFKVTNIPRGYQFRWNGLSVSLEELKVLFPQILGGQSRLSELGMAILGGRKKFVKVQVESSGARLTLEGKNFSIKQIDHKTDGTSVRLVGEKQRSLIPIIAARRALKPLSKRCSHAPLNWKVPFGVPVPKPLYRGTAIRLGSTNDLTGRTLHYRHIAPEIGNGILLLNDLPCPATIVNLGISYTVSPDTISAPGRLIWWTDQLPLDLSRSDFVRDERFSVWAQEVNQEIELAAREAYKKSPDNLASEILQQWFMWKDQNSEVQQIDLGDKAATFYQGSEAYIKTMQYEEALRCAMNAARIEPNYWPQVALCQGLLGKFEDAIESYENALKFQPYQSYIHANYAEDLMLCSEEALAIERVNIALELDSKNSHALALKAKLLSKVNKNLAKELANKAASYGDCPASVWETLASLHIDSGEKSEARSCLQKFVRLAHPETLWENDVHSRVSEAKIRLHELGASDA